MNISHIRKIKKNSVKNIPTPFKFLFLVRSRKEGDKGAMAIDEFIKAVKEEIDTKRI